MFVYKRFKHLRISIKSRPSFILMQTLSLNQRKLCLEHRYLTSNFYIVKKIRKMLLFLCIILCTCKVLSDSGGMFWRGTQDISEKSFFLSSTLQSLYAESQVQCAMGAMNIFWSRMFCYKNGVCNVSNLDIPPIPNNSSGSPVCFTSSSEFGSKVILSHLESLLL